jgi:signal transduction histidine kinase
MSKGILTIFSTIPQRRVMERFTLAVALAALAVLLRWLLDPVLGHVAFYATVYIAAAFCVVVCGPLPAIVTTLLGFFGIFYWFVDPRHSVTVPASEVHAVAGFFLVCGVLILLGDANRRKEMKLNQAVTALTKEAAERLRAEQELQKAHDVLEERVEERTAELSQTLAQLASEVGVRKHAEEQLRYLSVRLMTLQDEERRRFARELHDSAGQTLAAIKMTAALIEQGVTKDSRIKELFDELNALADDAIQEVRTTSYLLHPPLLDEAGIASAARWFVEGFAKRSGIEVNCDVPEKLERPPRDCELVLFRVLQESLTNVHRHSGASAARIKLALHADRLKLEIADNGNGIPPDRLKSLEAAETAGVGIAGMRERVREMGGRLEIQSGNSGTTVSVILPISKASTVNTSSSLGVSAA